jgi:hypothetical protein
MSNGGAYDVNLRRGQPGPALAGLASATQVTHIPARNNLLAHCGVSREISIRFDHHRSVITNQLITAGPEVHPPITAVELPNGIQLAYADEQDQRRVVDLEDADAVDFGRSRPFRKLPSYRGQRNFPGWWWSATTRSHVAYESWLERHHLMEADRDARVAGIAGQPFELTWPRGNGKRRATHVPDFLFRTLDGRAIVTDCRPVLRSDEDFRVQGRGHGGGVQRDRLGLPPGG